MFEIQKNTNFDQKVNLLFEFTIKNTFSLNKELSSCLHYFKFSPKNNTNNSKYLKIIRNYTGFSKNEERFKNTS